MSQCQHWLAGQIPGKQRLTRLPPSCVSHSGLVAADVSEPQQQQQKPKGQRAACRRQQSRLFMQITAWAQLWLS